MGKDIFIDFKAKALIQTDELNKTVKTAQNIMQGLSLPKGVEKSFKTVFSDLTRGLEALQNSAEASFSDPKDVLKYQKAYEAVSAIVSKLTKEMSQLNAKDVKIGSSHVLSTKIKEQEAFLRDYKEALGRLESQYRNTQRYLQQGLSGRVDINFDKVLEAVQAGKDYNEIFNELKQEARIKLDIETAKLTQANEELERLENKLKSTKEPIQKGDTLVRRKYDKAKDSVEQQKVEVEKLKDSVKELGAAFESNEKKINKMSGLIKSAVETNHLPEKIADTNEEINKLESQKVTEVANAMGKAQEKTEQLTSSLQEGENELLKMVQSANEMQNLDKQVVSLQNNMLGFFSLTSGWNLFKKVIRSAYETVKELDAAMTEIAVVSDYSLGEVWALRDNYSKSATQMGAATIDMIDAAKLYVQQGLSLAEANEVAIETIKMARIANLDGATATNLMTAAIRGFNMELTEANRINDVYSWLAAKSAADTREIADAMTRTASIANSAGASFENTSAFLTQMIETTRESAENLGTALKTIVARFQEMKKAPSEVGEIDGEIVDANKIEAALRTVGIALRDATGQFRNFDDVIFDISAKWDTMDQLTQRYIATTAAGSRQQSRFIALVQNNARLVELSSGAMNSAGSANEQFEKTLGSLQASLNNMHNALDLLWTNMVDSVVVKGAIDLFTKLIDILNKVLKIFPGVTKSAVAFGATFATFKGANKAIQGTFTRLARAIVTGSGQSFVNAGKTLSEKTTVGFFTALKGFGREKKLDLFSYLIDSGKLNKGSDLYQQLSKEIDLVGKSYLISGASSAEYLSALKAINTAQEKGFFLTTEQIAALDEEAAQRLITAHSAIASAKGTEKANREAEFNSIAMEISTQQNKKAYTQQLLYAAVTQIGTWATSLNTKATWANMVANQANAIAAKIASLSALQFQLILLATVVAVVALVAVFKKLHAEYKKTTLDYRMKAAAEATKEAADAAEAAKTAYEGLFDAFDKYKNSQLALEKLVVGTKEWKEELLKANSEVLKLLTDYPILAKFISKGKKGQLAIEEEGWDAAISAAENKVKMSQSILLQRQSGGLKLEEEKTTRATAEKTGLSVGQTVALARRYLQDGETLFKKTGDDFSEELKELADQLRLSVEEVFNLKEEIAAYSIEVEHYNSKIEQNEKEVTKNLVDSKYLVSGSKEAAAVSYASKQKIKEGSYQRYKWGFSSERKKYATEELGIEIAKKAKDAYKDLYKELIGEIPSEIEDDKNKLRDAVLEAIKLKDQKKYVEEFAKKIEGVNDAYVKALSEEGNFLTEEEAKQIVETQISDISKAFFKAGFSEEESAEIANNIIKSAQLAASGFEEAKKIFLKAMTIPKGHGVQTYGEEDFSKATKGLDKESTVGLSTQLAAIAKRDGVEVASQILKSMNETFSGEGGNKIKDAYKQFSLANLSSRQGIRDFGADLKALGTEIPNESINKFTRALIDTTNAINKIDIEKIKSAVQALFPLLSSLLSGTNKGILSEDEYNAVIALDGTLKNKFLPDLEGNYVYLGGKTDSLILAILENTAAIRGDTVDKARELTSKVEMGKQLADNKELNFSTFGTAEVLRNRLSAAIGVLNDKDKGELTFDTENIDDMSHKELRDALSELKSLKTNLEANKVELETVKQTISQIAFSADTRSAAVDASILATEARGKAGISTEESKQYEDALIAMARATGVAENVIESYSVALKSGRQELIKTSEAALVNATRQKQLSIILGNTLDEWSSHTKKLEEYKEDSTEYQLILEDLADTLGMKVTDPFFDNAANIDLIKLAAEGSTAALYELMNELSKNYGFTVSAEGNFENLNTEMDTSAEGLQDFIMMMYKAGLFTIAEEEVKSGQVYFKPQYEEVNGQKILTGVKPEKATETATVSVLRPIDKPVIERTKVNRNVGGGRKSSGGGSGSKSEAEPWKNSHDWLYNLMQKTNEEIRKRNALEWKYNQLLIDRKQSAKSILDSLYEQEASLKKQQQYYREQMSGRIKDSGKIQKEYSDVAKYAKYDAAVGYVEIDWKAIEAISGKKNNQETGKRIDEFIGKLETISGQIDDLEDKQREIITNLQELNKQGQDNYLSLANEARDALLELKQSEIDQLTNLAAKMDSAASKVLNGIQQSISEERERRDMDKSREEIEAMERRLSLLQSDSSGANALEIMKLEEELKNKRQSYTDSLIDQVIADIQEGNDAAAQQRQDQIDILQHNLDESTRNGELWNETNKILSDAFGKDGKLEGSVLEELLTGTEAYLKKSITERDNFKKDTQAAIEAGFGWWMKQNMLSEDTLKKQYQGKTITFTDASGTKRTGKVDKKGKVTIGGKVYSNIYQAPDGSFKTATAATNAPKKTTAPTSSTSSLGNFPKTNYSGVSIVDALKTVVYGDRSKWPSNEVLYGKVGSLADIAKANGITGYNWSDAHNLELLRLLKAGSLKKFKAYAHGGLADFTGPAWLDGTKSRPEMVLKPDDTKNFIQLKDILSSLLKGGETKSGAGNNYYSFEVQVDEIANDYDVEQLMDKIRRMIEDDARYRNVNALNFIGR